MLFWLNQLILCSQFLELPNGTFELRGSRIYHLFDSSYNTTPDTLECLSLMYYAIFPEMAVPQVGPVAGMSEMFCKPCRASVAMYSL